jgi:hypothetical protein
MRSHALPRLGFIVATVLLLSVSGTVTAVAPGNGPFQRTWARTDKPVADLLVTRTWMWGPEANSPLLYEEYDEASGGKRVVQYFDKSRMEINNPAHDVNDPWYVTNGLLVNELITGQKQVGENRFEPGTPSLAYVVGDQDDSNGVAYAHLGPALRGDPGFTEQYQQGDTIILHFEWFGGGPHMPRVLAVTPDERFAVHEATAVQYVAETGKWVASPFWDFMTSSGPVYEDGTTHDAALFQNPYYATGFPVTNPYWGRFKVAGTVKDVLLQCFQRRCLTYTPDNPDGWKVEAGNVGQHYYDWRYAEEEPEPVPIPTTGNLRIGDILWDSPAPGEQSGEWVVIVNDDEHAVQMQGWRLEDAGATNTFVFPDFVLPPGASVTIHNCTGANTSTDLFTGGCNPWWNNDGDTANLYDATGALVDSLTY